MATPEKRILIPIIADHALAGQTEMPVPGQDLFTNFVSYSYSTYEVSVITSM